MTYAETPSFGGYGRRRHRHRHGMLMFGGKHRHARGEFPFGRGGRRAGRGDIRAAILALLSESSMHGYQIIRELSERTGGAWTPSPGSVYPTLQQLEDEELVVEQKSDTGRRVYTLTEAGREKAAALPSPAPWEQAAAAAGDENGRLPQPGVPGARSRQAGRRRRHPGPDRGRPEVLRTARRSLYQILAEDPAEEPKPKA